MFFRKSLKSGLGVAVVLSALVSVTACNRKAPASVLIPETVTGMESVPSESAENQYIIKKKGLAYIDESFESKYNLKVIKKIPSLLIDVVEIESESSLEELKQNPGIEFVEPNYIRRMKTQVTSSQAASTMQVRQAGIEKANTINRGKPFITVAVIGTGVDQSHPDLKNKLVPGYSTFGANDSASDINGAGTHQAGVIVASNRNYGIYGVAPNCKIMPVKAMNQGGEIKDSSLIDGIAWAVEHGASVITLTAEGSQPSKAIDDAIKFAFDKKVPVVVGAGDSSSTQKTYPAAAAGVIAVSAANNNSLATFSNSGPWTSVAAPGVNIMSTSPSKNVFLNSKGLTAGYGTMSGSFISAALVAGNIALIKSQYPALDMIGIKTHLEMTSDDLGAPGPDTQFGYGRINAAKALMVQPPRR